MKSMTGYGQAQAKIAGVTLEVGVRTVNGRFLDTRLHSPRDYVAMESEMKKKMSSVFRRGTVDLYVNKKLSGETQRKQLKIQTDLAKQWVKGYRALAKELKTNDDFELKTLVSQEPVLSFEENQQLTTAEKKAVLDTIQKAIGACDKERIREGKFLKKDIGGLLGQLSSLTTKMKKARSQANSLLEERLKTRLEKLNYPGEVDPSRLAQEVVVQIDKADISEEITRLGEHIQHMKTLLNASEAIGKKLDFYTQELLREVNTIGSKSSLAELTAIVVDAKTTVERIREQVQNIE